jgi:hypothetical protein
VSESPVSARTYRRQSVEATIIHGCRSCGAPGIYQADNEQTRAALGQFHAIILPLDDSRVGTAVGDICPCCGEKRLAPKNLGKIWERLFG